MDEIKTLIAIPCMDMVATPFMYSLVCMRRAGLSRVSVVSNSLVHMARNMLAAEAIDSGCDRVLWLDSDMFFAPELMGQLAADMDDGKDYVTGLVFRRQFPTMPILYSALDGEPVIYTDYPREQLFQIAGSGFGAVMTSTKLLKDVFDAYGSPFNPIGDFGEDTSFCIRAGKLGYELWCDSRIRIGHAGQIIFGEDHYAAQMGWT